MTSINSLFNKGKVAATLLQVKVGWSISKVLSQKLWVKQLILKTH